MKNFTRKTLITLALVTLAMPVKAETIYTEVNGLVCDFCARALDKVFSARSDVESIDVNLDTKIITINAQEKNSLDDETITELITDAGYNVESIERISNKVDIIPEESLGDGNE